jgi:hypothetical protein
MARAWPGKRQQMAKRYPSSMRDSWEEARMIGGYRLMG